MKSVLLYKYGLIVIDFCIVILAAFGMDEIVRGRLKRRVLAAGVVTAASYLAWAIWYTSGHPGFTHRTWSTWAIGLTIVILVGTALSASWNQRGRARAGLTVALFVGAEAVGTFAVPQITSSAPRSVDVAPVHYLQQHLGTSRLYSLGPIEANYGSYWGIAQVNVNDLPVPNKFSQVITNALKPTSSQKLAKATGRAFLPYELSPLGSTVKYEKLLFAAYLEKQQHFRDIGVKFVVARPGAVDAKQASAHHLTRVFGDAKAEIWQDADAKPYYELTSGCSVQKETLSGVDVRCAKPAVLLRRQLASPGWHVNVNGKQQSVGEHGDGLFQSVQLPAGTSHLSFTYIPKYFRVASGVSILMALGMLLDGGAYLRSRRTTSV